MNVEMGDRREGREEVDRGWFKWKPTRGTSRGMANNKFNGGTLENSTRKVA